MLRPVLLTCCQFIICENCVDMCFNNNHICPHCRFDTPTKIRPSYIVDIVEKFDEPIAGEAIHFFK